MEEMGANASGEVDSVNLYLTYTYIHTILLYTVGAPWLGGRQGCPEVQELPWLQEQEEMRKSNAVLVCHGA